MSCYLLDSTVFFPFPFFGFVFVVMEKDISSKMVLVTRIT